MSKQRSFQGWQKVTSILRDSQQDMEHTIWLNESQWASIGALCERVVNNGVIIADEVGMGKTRIAVELCHAVTEAGGRVAIVVPSGLAYQWQEEFARREESTRKNKLIPSQHLSPPVIRSLWGYLQAWNQDHQGVITPWFQENALIITHSFTNWRLSCNSEPWRWALLPLIYALWRKESGQFPRGFQANKKLFNDVENAGRSIVDFVNSNIKNESIKRTIESINEYEWNMKVNQDRFHSTGNDRPLLRKAVGLGLGAFDLIIIDEAHKNRTNGGLLNNLLNDVLITSQSAKFLAMTATPIELCVEQWDDILDRIGVKENKRKSCVEKAQNYIDSVKSLRHCWVSSPQARTEYANASQAFQNALAPYLIRRDKRNDPTIQKFMQETGENHDAYRQHREIRIAPETLSPVWLNALFAAESLSLLRDPELKRLRLTMGNGHGIAALLDYGYYDQESDSDPEQEEQTEYSLTGSHQERIQWWRELLTNSLKETSLYDHPALLAVASEVEQLTNQGQKVLIFGRFTAPLRALTELLNARLIVRAFLNRNTEQIKAISQEKLHQTDKKALNAAQMQLNCHASIEEIEHWLEKQYKQLEGARSSLRKNLINHLTQALKKESFAFRLLQQIQKDDDLNKGLIALLTYAIEELSEGASNKEYADAFEHLIRALDDKSNEQSNAEDDEKADLHWPTLKQRLCEHYQTSQEKNYHITAQSSYARLLNGQSSHPTRRLLQAAFNLSNRSPEVLVAQSLVGREGLNLHEACKVVFLLHPEWNPGVVEQQIGRVDRLGSRWSQEFEQWCQNKIGPAPKIEIRPVIFAGTYDEYNWQVLQKRWNLFRAQLHGMVIPLSEQQHLTAEQKKIIAEIEQTSPDFSPRQPIR